MSIIVRTPGLLSTIQDGGRYGYAAQGYRTCGAADTYAWRLGNALLGNPADAACIECTLQGIVVECKEDTLFALTGAECTATVDGAEVPCYAAVLAPAGSMLRVGMAEKGLRTYLSVGGGIATEPVLGSRSTDLKCRLGGHDGRALMVGDRLLVGWTGEEAREQWERIRAHGGDQPLSDYREQTGVNSLACWEGKIIPRLRAVAGPQECAFTEAGLETFTHSLYTLSSDCDRMACKLKGTAIEMVQGADILSDGIAAGSVQVSSNGLPIVMLADHQTTGGYAKVATVISADLPTIAQCRPGDQVMFTFVTPAEAVAAARAQAAVLQNIRERYSE